jgi:Lon protease-like protein
LPPHAFLAVIYHAQGRHTEARAEWAAASRLSPQASLESLTQVVPYKNERDLARLLTAMRQAGLK